MQEALAAAATQWLGEGVPENPLGWLIRVAARRMIDHLRSEVARRTREERQALRMEADPGLAGEPAGGASDRDDSLILLLMCCHPR